MGSAQGLVGVILILLGVFLMWALFAGKISFPFGVSSSSSSGSNSSSSGAPAPPAPAPGMLPPRPPQ